jgi:hypothetical protein
MYTQLSVIITFILLFIAAAAELPRSSYAISINYTKLNSYEQYKIIKQVVDNNAFSNLSRNLSPPVTSNSRGLTNLAPGNSSGSSTTSTSGGSFSSHNRGAVNQLTPGNSGGSNSNSTGLTNLAPGNSGGSNSNSTGLTNLAPGNSGGSSSNSSNSTGLTNLAPGNR